MKFYTIIAAGFVALTALESSAYNFTFKNHLDTPMTVSAQLVGAWEPHHSIGVPAKIGQTAGEETFVFDGRFIGFCMNGNTVRLAKQGGAELVEAPIAFVSQKAYNKIMDAMATGGKTTPLGTAKVPRTVAGICGNQTFDIVLDREGNPRAIMVY